MGNTVLNHDLMIGVTVTGADPGGGAGVFRVRGGGGALTLVLGTHCKTDSWSCGCRLEKRGLSQTQELSEGGHFLLGL